MFAIGLALAGLEIVLVLSGVTVVAGAHYMGWLERFEPILNSGFLVYMLLLFIAGLALAGYILRVIKVAAMGEDKLPGVRPLGPLLKEGLKSLLLIYPATYFPATLAVLALVSVGLAALGVSGVAQDLLSERVHNWLNIGLAGGFGLAYVGTAVGLVLIFYLFAPLMVTRFAVTGQGRWLFSWRWAARTVFANLGSYLACFVPVFLFTVAFLVCSLLTLGLAGILFYPFAPLAWLNCAHLLGRFYAEKVQPPAEISP